MKSRELERMGIEPILFKMLRFFDKLRTDKLAKVAEEMSEKHGCKEVIQQGQNYAIKKIIRLRLTGFR